MRRRRCRRRSYRRLGWNNDGGGRTRDRLRRNETRRWLGRFRRSCWCGAGHGCNRFRNRTRRTNGGRRRNRLARPGGCGKSRRRGRTRSRGRLGGPLRNRLEHIARFGDVRKIQLALEFVCRCARRGTSGAGLGVLRKVFLDPLRFVHFDGTGVRFLFGYTNLDESIEDHLALYLELPRQVVNSNLLHSALFPPYCPARLSCHSILTVKFCRPATEAGALISARQVFLHQERFRFLRLDARAWSLRLHRPEAHLRSLR